MLGGLESTPQRGSAELSGGSATSCGGSNPPDPPVKYSPGDSSHVIGACSMFGRRAFSVAGAMTWNSVSVTPPSGPDSERQQFRQRTGLYLSDFHWGVRVSTGD